jgi:hypothetical protein
MFSSLRGIFTAGALEQLQEVSTNVGRNRITERYFMPDHLRYFLNLDGGSDKPMDITGIRISILAEAVE